MDYYLQRRNHLFRALKKDGHEALLVTNPTNVRYLSGFTGDSSYLLLTTKNIILISDSRFELQIAEECKDVEVVIRPHTKKLLDAAAEVVVKSGLKSVGVEAAHITVMVLEALSAAVPKVTFAQTKNTVEALRNVKDSSEVEAIRQAVRVAERAFHMFVSTLRETDTEKEMVDSMEAFVRRAGGLATSFPPIVAVGERGALPHALPTTRPFQEGTKLLVDWGADLGYKSDLTRTLKSPFSTIPTRRNKLERTGYAFEELYAIVQKAQDAAVKMLRHGVAAKDVDSAARKVFADAKLRDAPQLKLADHFTHGLGHGIGLEIHEGPSIRANSEDILEAGMVVTIEPGIYIPEWGGIRLEDDFLILKDGANRLTTLPHDYGAIH